MIEAEVERNGIRIITSTFYDTSLTLEGTLKSIEMYIVNEQLNKEGECFIRVRFPESINGRLAS